MATRRLLEAPNTVLLYAKAAAPLVPGASLLPFVGGRGDAVPELELTLEGVRPDPRALADYARVCCFRLRDELPPTYPQVLSFPLQLAVLTDARFPVAAMGLVYLSNRITVHRPLRVTDALDIAVRPTPLRPHRRGRTVSVLTQVSVGGELAYEGEATYLSRGGGSGAAGEEPAAPNGRGAARNGRGEGSEALPFVAEWRLPADLGRRYAAVSGDRNPIHLYGLSARLLGFRSAIAHGMWSKARCLAALEGSLPDAYTVDVAFRKPAFLPGRVRFNAERGERETRFEMRSAKRPDVLHLEGALTPKARRRGRRRAS